MCATMTNQMRGLAEAFGLLLSMGKGQVLEQSADRALPDGVILRDLFGSLLTVLSNLKGNGGVFYLQLARFAREDMRKGYLRSKRAGEMFTLTFDMDNENNENE